MRRVTHKQRILYLIDREIRSTEITLKSERKYPSYPEAVQEYEDLIRFWQDARDMVEKLLPS